MVQGKVVEYDPPRRLVDTFQPHAPTGELIDIAESRLIWEIKQNSGTCTLRLTHDKLDGDNPAAAGFGDGWNYFMAEIKKYLESE
jgi:uncharacterized protein YndB with AHSA1/START domain